MHPHELVCAQQFPPPPKSQYLNLLIRNMDQSRDIGPPLFQKPGQALDEAVRQASTGIKSKKAIEAGHLGPQRCHGSWVNCTCFYRRCSICTLRWMLSLQQKNCGRHAFWPVILTARGSCQVMPWVWGFRTFRDFFRCQVVRDALSDVAREARLQSSLRKSWESNFRCFKRAYWVALTSWYKDEPALLRCSSQK